MRLGLLAASLVLVAGGAVGCSDDGGGDGGGGDDAPSAKDFCGALKDFQDDFADADPTKDLKGYIQTLKDAADKLETVGTPDDMPADAQDGFDFYVRRSRTSSDDATLDDLASIGDVSDADQKKLDALDDYVSKTCPDLNGEPDELGESLDVDDKRRLAGLAHQGAAGRLPVEQPAVEVDRVATLLDQVAGHPRGAGADLADHEDLAVRHLLESRGHLGHGDVHRACDVAVRPLHRLADVEHGEPLGQRVGYAGNADRGNATHVVKWITCRSTSTRPPWRSPWSRRSCWPSSRRWRASVAGWCYCRSSSRCSGFGSQFRSSPSPSWSRTGAGSPSTGTTSTVAWSGWFALGAIPCAVGAGLLFATAPLEFLQRLLGVLLVVVVVLRRLRPHPPRLAPRAFVGVGAASGLGSALVGSVGPLTAPFFLARGLVKEAYIGTEAMSAVVLHAAKLVAYGLGALLSAGVLVLGLLLAPATMFGAWAGRHVVRRISERAFVLVVEVGLVVSALLLLVSP